MIIMWSGYGLATWLIALAFAITGEGALQPAISNALPDAPAHTGMAFGLVVAAAANWYLGLGLNKHTGREFFDPKTRSSALNGAHTFFWIPMQYFSALMIAAAVVALLVPGPKVHRLPAPESSAGAPQ